MNASVVGDLAMQKRGGVGIGVVKKLLDLVASDVAKDAAESRLVPKPVGTRGGIESVRAEPDDLEHATNGAALHEPSCVHRRFDVQPLGVVDGVFHLRCG